MAEMDGMIVPPVLSISRLGYGMEMFGALGNNEQFGFDWNAQQHYLGAILTYAIPSSWSVRLEPAFGLSDVSDHFILRTGVVYMLGQSSSKTME
jgi:hypothetical protein